MNTAQRIEALYAIAQIARGEGIDIEFKIASAGVHDDVFETVCSFANGKEGDIFLGVNDHGQVVGLSQETLVAIKRDVRRACSSNGLFTTAVPVGIQELVVNRHHIVHIKIPHIHHGVAYKGKCYIRLGDADYLCQGRCDCCHESMDLS